MGSTRCWDSLRAFRENVIIFGLTSSRTAVSPVSWFLTVYVPVCWMYILPTIRLLMVVWTCRVLRSRSRWLNKYAK